MEAGDPLDTAHGFAHIDRYNLRGRAKKERLALSFSEALTRAEREIKQTGLYIESAFCEENGHDVSRKEDDRKESRSFIRV